MTEKLYKILEAGKSCHGGNLAWSLPKGKKPGKWHSVEGDLKLCENGIHLTDRPAAWFRWNCEIYEAEASGEVIWDRDSNKCVVRKARLLKKLPSPTWWTDAHHFVEKDIPSVPWMKPDGKPLPEWKLFTADSLDAAEDAALMARLRVVQDLKIEQKHIDHAKARWNVWQKGYALLCDVNGVLYVYAKKSPGDEGERV